MEPRNQPDSFILESVENGIPVIHVVINYRLGRERLPNHTYLCILIIISIWLCTVGYIEEREQRDCGFS
jgi:hypothetical protein